jgi:hypothetical protein
MKRSTGITVGLVTAVLVFLFLAGRLAITLGLVFGVGKQNHTDSIETTPEQETTTLIATTTTERATTTTEQATTTTEQATTTSTTTTTKLKLTVEEEILRNFTNNVVFPYGSYVLPLSNLSTDPSAQAPVIVNNISVLTQVNLVMRNSSKTKIFLLARYNAIAIAYACMLYSCIKNGSPNLLIQIGVNADSTNDVIVSGRQTILYIAAPSQQTSTTTRKRRAAPDIDVQFDDIGLCVQFSTSNDCHMVPYDLQDSGSGCLPLIQRLYDQIVYQLPIAAPFSLCQSSNGSRCVSVTYQTYAVSRGIRSPASEPASLSIACGSQCQGEQGTCKQLCRACNSERVSGTDTPMSRRYLMQNQTSGSFLFVYETYNVRDRMLIQQDDVVIFDSGCVGTNGERNVNVTFSGTSDEIRVDVEPNCSGTTGTGWYFDVRCPLTS